MCGAICRAIILPYTNIIHMQRRDLVWTALVAAFGGCSEEVKEPTKTPTPSPAGDTTTDSPTPDANPQMYEAPDQRHVALDGETFSELRIDVLPEAVPLAGEVKLEEQPADGEDGILMIGLQNRDNRPWAMRAAVPLPFPPAGSDGGLWVSETPAPKADGGCARGPAAADGAYSRKQLPPDDRIEGIRYIHNLNDTSTCYKTGTHSFQNRYAVYDELEADQPRLRFRWGFSLVVD